MERSASKHESPIEAMTEPDMNLTPDQFVARCRAVAIADSLQKVSEAIVHDRAQKLVTDHLELARTGLLDALSVLAEREGA